MKKLRRLLLRLPAPPLSLFALLLILVFYFVVVVPEMQRAAEVLQLRKQAYLPDGNGSEW
jgi:hypothetical protein